MQKYNRVLDYIHEYQNLVYDYYGKHGIPFLVNYYNIDRTNTVWENEYLMGGSYEDIGNLTGKKFNKYLLLPVYFIEEITTIFDAQEVGYVKENDTTIVIPYSYEITPYPGDMFKLEQDFMRPTNNIYPLFIVSGAQISANTDKRFWSLKAHIKQSRTTSELDLQVTNNYVFYEYDKTIHTVDEATFLTKLLLKNESLKDNLISKFDNNSGFYFL